MDEELVETDVPSVGERLRAAREEKGLSLEDIAAQTRIPRRHLESIEAADWDRLPAQTYTIGFARNYASVVGLDRAEVADQLRAEMGGQRTTTTAEVFEPADPARTMPKWLVIGAILAVIVLIVGMSWLRSRSLEQPDENVVNAPAARPPVVQPSAPPPAPTPVSEPVVLTATDAVWLQVYEKGGAILFSGNLQPGRAYAVPPTATAPLLKTGKPEAIRVTVGNRALPPVGPAATMVKDISLLPADLLKATQPAAPGPQTAAPPAARRSAPPSAAPAPPASPPPAETQPQPATNAT
jgi:cytoskeleton protein RodZ